MIDTPGRAAVLLCAADERLVALPLGHVIETMRPLPIEPLVANGPGTDLVRGMAIVRGAPVPVVDAGRLVGGTPLERPARFVTVRTGSRCAALAVTAVLGVHRLDASDLLELPALRPGAADDISLQVGALDAKLLYVLSAARLVPDGLWRSIEARGAA